MDWDEKNVLFWFLNLLAAQIFEVDIFDEQCTYLSKKSQEMKRGLSSPPLPQHFFHFSKKC